NFGYELHDAVVAVLVRIGEELHTVLVTPGGVVELPTVDTGHAGDLTREVVAQGEGAVTDPAGLPSVDDLRQLATLGASKGQAGLNFEIHPRGADRGTLTFLYVPLSPTHPASVHVGDLSFELTTWQRIDWPPTENMRDGKMV